MKQQQDSLDWSPLRELIEQRQRFVLTSHVRPDCDALGSELAMAGLLRGAGKEVQIVNADPVPQRLAFLDPARQIQVLSAATLAAVNASDVIMVLDTSAWIQLGDMADVIRTTSAHTVVIDHHASAPQVPGTILQDAEAEATGRLVYDAARFLQMPITSDMAVALFAALATDTGWFRFPSTTARTYEVVGDLVACGAQPHEIYAQLYERDSMSRAKLRGIVLMRLETELEGRLAHTQVLAEDFAVTGAQPNETEDFVNMGLAIDGAEVAVMFTQLPSGGIKVSLRSRGAVDCSTLAATFGGGGHRAAAGATVSGPFEMAQEKVLQAVRAAMQPSA